MYATSCVQKSPTPTSPYPTSSPPNHQRHIFIVISNRACALLQPRSPLSASQGLSRALQPPAAAATTNPQLPASTTIQRTETTAEIIVAALCQQAIGTKAFAQGLQWMGKSGTFPVCESGVFLDSTQRSFNSKQANVSKKQVCFAVVQQQKLGTRKHESSNGTRPDNGQPYAAHNAVVRAHPFAT